MTTPKRKLIEVALPLEAINRESAREKSIRHGHPSTLHLWWARRPLAACRAVLFAQLVDDPSSHPDQFPTEADQALERKRLFDIIERLVIWENTTDEALLAEAHAEILKSCDGNPPAILDPFAGGGSIPLEAQRLGLEAHASDLNPVAVLINKALIEIPPKWAGQPPVFPGAAAERIGGWPGATGLAEDVRRYGQWMRDEAERRIGHLYPKATLPDGTKANVIAWIWARTVTCPNPACGIEMPLVRSWWLGKKKGKEAYVVPNVVTAADGSRRVEFGIGHDVSLAPTKGDDGTVSRTGAVCLGCQTAVPLTYVRAEGKAGRIGARMMAIAAEGDRRRVYLAPTSEHEVAAVVPVPDNVPDGELADNVWDIKVKNYGMTDVSDLFTPRQLTALTTFSDLVSEARDRVFIDAVSARPQLDDAETERLEAGGKGDAAYADGVGLLLAFALSRSANMMSSLTGWVAHTKMEALRGVFARQAISMVWDFAEAQPFAGSSGDLSNDLDWVARVVARSHVSAAAGTVSQADAAGRDYRGVLVSTDPPYYDNVGYANLSDFFYSWLRRSLRGIFPGLLGTMQTPKVDELVADPYRHGTSEDAQRFFEGGFNDVFARIRVDAPDRFPITVFYAFKQADSDDSGTTSTGWQTLLEGMLRSGWEVTATWPVRTEYQARVKAIDTNSLASSIVLACRPRPESAATVNRRTFIAALKAELPKALRDLQQGSIAPVDMAQAAIGPGMSVFSRYARVLEADGSDMTVRTALALINQALDEVLTQQEGDFDSDTRFAVKWFTQFGWNDAGAGEADVLARATNTSIDALVRGGIFKATAGKARLLAPDDLDPVWDPDTDVRISDWEVTVRLAKAITEDGVPRAAALMAAARSRVDLDTVKELAYLLFSLSEKKGWTATALLFNSLGTLWSEVESAARAPAPANAEAQTSLSFDT